MSSLISVAAVLFCCVSFCWADPGAIFKPGSVHEQHLNLPSTDADVAQIFRQLLSSEEDAKEAALQWLLRREDAQDLGYFQTDSIRFSVEKVSEVIAPD